MERDIRLFTGIIHHDEGSAFGITFPNVTGCFAAADGFDGVIAAGAEALALWFEDRPTVEPSPPETVDPKGGTLVAIPYIQPMQDTVRANLSLPRHVVRAIDAAAKQRGLTRSAFVAYAALAEIEGRH